MAEAERLSYGHLFNPTFATEVSLIDPLPHQRIAVYEHMLTQPRLRLLLADDAGAGKTIMAGLYIREMLARRLVRRVLIVPPAGLVGNWERELRTLFSLNFRIIRGPDVRQGNPFADAESDLAICSVDTLSGERVFGPLKDPSVEPYDLVIFDEAHKLAADREADLTVRRTERYKLAESLAGIQTDDARWLLPWSAQHLLLLTATPHMGKDYPYYCLWRLLEPEVLPTLDAFNAYPTDARRRHFIRRTKEEMVHLDGRPLYPTRESNTLSFDLTQGSVSEQALYDKTTAYMQAFYNAAQILNRSAARLAMSVFQRRLASSTFAVKRSFERRLERLNGFIERVRAGRITADELLKAQRELNNRRDPFDDSTADDDATEDGQERHELAEDELLETIIYTSLGELEAERTQVQELVELAQAVLDTGQESKFEKLRDVLSDPQFRDEKLIVFTEHRDTLAWLGQRLEALGFTDKIAFLHGGMDYKERERQVEHFRRADGAQYLVATDAAGEGINLQFCWLMVNYDIPWNPARLEQRMGRIHRYKQQHDPVIIVNLVAGKTREGRVQATQLRKLEAMRRELGSDKVFDVIGRTYENVSITALMAQCLTEDGASEAVKRIEGTLTKEQIEALEAREKRLFGDGGDVKGELPRLRDQSRVEMFRRLLPGYVRQFVERAAAELDLVVDGDLDDFFALRSGRAAGLDLLWPVLESYPEETRERLTVHRPSESEDAIFLHPGEPLFERLRAVVLDRFAADAQRGAVFIDPTAVRPYIFHLAEITVERRAGSTGADGDAELLECRLVGLKDDSGVIDESPVEYLQLLRGSDRFPPEFARVALAAEESKIRASQYAEEKVAAPLAAARQRALLDSLAEREEFLVRGYNSQDAELASQRARLTDRLRAGDAKARAAVDAIKQQQRTLADRRDAAVATLRAEPAEILPGEIRFLAHALVVPSADPEDRKRHDAEVEAIAMQVATVYEEALGATVRDVSTPPKARAAGLSDSPGFDLLSIYPSGERRAIEVKGRAAIGDVEVTENEWAKACNLRDGYWLYVVFNCASQHPQVTRVRDPFGKLLVRAKGGVVIDESAIFAAAES
ncbi:MAG: RNA polymerase-associated protein RapA [Phycisphaerae bacterium]|nr:RNA polymerase-associated protein RapA [Phycisphaerae bacterium]